MNPEMHLKILQILGSIYPKKHISIEVDANRSLDLYGNAKIRMEFRLYVADSMYEEFESVVDLMKFVTDLTKRSEVEVLPVTLKFSDFKRQTGNSSF